MVASDIGAIWETSSVVANCDGFPGITQIGDLSNKDAWPW